MFCRLLPNIGFKHDPDGINYQRVAGHLFLSWVDDHGVTQTRYYDGAGNRNDGSGETLAGDFMKHTMDAIAPAWAVQTTLAHWQAGNGLHLPTEKASLPQESADGITQTLQVLTLAVPGFEPPRQSLIDVDGDGYLEASELLALKLVRNDMEFVAALTSRAHSANDCVLQNEAA